MSTEPPSADRSRWLVPITVAVIAAVATVLAAAIPFTLNRGEGKPPSGAQTEGPQGTPSSSSRRSPTVAGRASTPASGSGTVLHSGFAVLVGSLSTKDIDRGGEAAPDEIPDIQMRATALAATAHSRIALLTGPAYGPEICREALAERSTTEVRAGEIQTGTVLCVMTTANRMGVIIIDAVRVSDGELRQINLNYIIWTETP